MWSQPTIYFLSASSLLIFYPIEAFFFLLHFTDLQKKVFHFMKCQSMCVVDVCLCEMCVCVCVNNMLGVWNQWQPLEVSQSFEISL